MRAPLHASRALPAGWARPSDSQRRSASEKQAIDAPLFLIPALPLATTCSPPPSSLLLRGCCSFALVPALFHFFVGGLGGRRPAVSVAAGPRRSCCSNPIPLCLHVRLPISLCLVGVVDLLCYRAGRRVQIAGKQWFSPWRRGVHGTPCKTLWWSSRVHFSPWRGRFGPRLRLQHGSVLGRLVRPLCCTSALCCCSLWRVDNRCPRGIESRR